MAQMHQSVDIARPLPQVVANPVNDALWDSNLVEVTKIPPGPPGGGLKEPNQQNLEEPSID